MGKEFANDFLDRGTVKITDKLLIHNIDTGETCITTVAELFTVKSPAVSSDIIKGYAHNGNQLFLLYEEASGDCSIYLKDIASNIRVALRTNGVSFFTGGELGIGTTTPKSKLDVVGLNVHANNAAALLAGLQIGSFYRTGADPDIVCVVH